MTPSRLCDPIFSGHVPYPSLLALLRSSVVVSSSIDQVLGTSKALLNGIELHVLGWYVQIHPGHIIFENKLLWRCLWSTKDGGQLFGIHLCIHSWWLHCSLGLSFCSFLDSWSIPRDNYTLESLNVSSSTASLRRRSEAEWVHNASVAKGRLEGVSNLLTAWAGEQDSRKHDTQTRTGFFGFVWVSEHLENSFELLRIFASSCQD